MGRTNHHHVVSKGFLRHFSITVDGTDGRSPWQQIELIRTADRSSRPVSTRDAFARRDFNTRWLHPDRSRRDDSLEHEWARIESETLPGLRAVVEGDRSAEALHDVRTLMALHLARSHAYRIAFDRLSREAIQDLPGEMAANSTTRRKFRSDFGRDPEPGEIEEIALSVWQHHMDTNQLYVERLAHGYNQIVEWLSPLNLELVRPVNAAVGFVIGDVPATIWRRGWISRGPGSGSAVREADQIFMPLSPWLGAALSTEPKEERRLRTIDVIWINRLTWHHARHVVGCHPNLNWRRCLSF